MDLRLALGRSASEAVTLVSRVDLCALPELNGDFHLEFLSFKTYDRHFETLVEIRSSPAAFCEAGRKCSLQLPYRRACQKPHCFSTRVLGEPEVSEDHDGIGRPTALNMRGHLDGLEHVALLIQPPESLAAFVVTFVVGDSSTEVYI